MYIKSLITKAITVSFVLALAGCGGDSSSDITPTPLPPPKPESKLLALDGFSTVKPDTKTRVNLSPFVRGDNVQIVSASVEGSDTHCGIPIIDGTSLDITAGNGAYCSYSYLAQSGDIQSYAQLRVLATDADVPMLPPVSQAMELGGSNLSLNLETLLGSDWPAGYQLNSSSVNVQGNEGNLGSIVSVTANTIVYKGPGLSGWNRLVYTISNPAKPGEDKMGVVYITVSEEVNQPPSIDVPKYPFQFAPKAYDKEITSADIGCTDVFICYESSTISAIGSNRNLFWLNKDGTRNIYLPVGAEYDGKTITIQNDDPNTTTIHSNGWEIHYIQYDGGRIVFKNFNGYWWSQNRFSYEVYPGFIPNDTIYAGETATIDLTVLHGIGIEEPDGQEWQLIDVQSYSATVTPTNPNSVTNKSFNFSAGTVGEHYVSYIIADHFGGYSSGLIKIKVSAKENPVTWGEIVSNGKTFTAPPIYSQAVNKGLNVSAQWDEGVKNTVAGFGQNTGTLYCDTIGVLPSVADLAALRQNTDTVVSDELGKWPKGQSYLAENGSTVIGYDLQTGVSQAYNPSTPYYVSCIENSQFGLQMTTYTVVANDKRVPVAKVTKTNAGTSLTLSKKSGTLNGGEVALLLEDTGSDTVKNITTQATKAGTYQFTVTDGSNTLSSGEVTYIGDVETAQFAAGTGLVVTKNNAKPDGIDAATVLATVTDVNGNPVQGVTVEGEVVSGSPGDTAKITPKGTPITDDKGQLVFEVKDTVVETVSVKVKAQIGTRNIESEAVDVAFRPVVILECQEGMTIADSCIETLSSGTRTLFTNNPSVNFVRTYMREMFEIYSIDTYNANMPDRGPVGEYVGFDQYEATYFCDKLNDYNHLGRSNWEWAVVFEGEATADGPHSLGDLRDWYPDRAALSAAGWNTERPYAVQIPMARGTPLHRYHGVIFAGYPYYSNESYWDLVNQSDHDWNGTNHPSSSCRSETP
ncbi:Ig-like domain-containing protein [Photobacterium leiognathi]|uniref:Ig-like domain-containing protein n=1 Tax=Photobacterium leiognathi TaxID=553611 RepID=UPI00298159E7|nr:Ig-like domain-containing protein [Photobacterium leiognathi]